MNHEERVQHERGEKDEAEPACDDRYEEECGNDVEQEADRRLDRLTDCQEADERKEQGDEIEHAGRPLGLGVTLLSILGG